MTRPPTTPTSAVVLPMLMPCPAKTTTKAIAAEASSPTRIGLVPLTSAGNTNKHEQDAGHPERQQGGEATPAGDEDHRGREDQGEDQQGCAATEVGELVLRRLPLDRRDPEQRDALSDGDPRGVDDVGDRDDHRLALVLAAGQLHAEVRADLRVDAGGGAGDPLAGDAGDVRDPAGGVADARHAVARALPIDVGFGVRRPERDEAGDGPDRQRNQDDDHQPVGPAIPRAPRAGRRRRLSWEVYSSRIPPTVVSCVTSVTPGDARPTARAWRIGDPRDRA